MHQYLPVGGSDRAWRETNTVFRIHAQQILDVFVRVLDCSKPNRALLEEELLHLFLGDQMTHLGLDSFVDLLQCEV